MPEAVEVSPQSEDENCLHESPETKVQDISLTIVHNRQRYVLNLSPQSTVKQIKQQLEVLTNVPVDMQKLVYQGILDENSTLSNLKLPSNGAKLMLIGTERSAAEKVRKSEQSLAVDESSFVNHDDDSGADWSTSNEHKSVLDRFGKPEDVPVGIINSEDILAPDEPLSGMYDKRGQSLRLRFKPDSSELWLATNAATYKIPLSTVHEVESQAIKGHPDYHIMALQLGPTKKSRFFIYWLPAQYVNSIKTMVLQFQCFTRESSGSSSNK